MWSKLPLNSKLILLLVVVQLSCLAIGIAWLTHHVKSARLLELHNQLDAQGDLVEDFAVLAEGKLSFRLDGETAQELNADRHFFFLMQSAAGHELAASKGPSDEDEAELRVILSSAQSPTELERTATINRHQWLIQSEPIERHDQANSIKGFLHVAIDIQPALDQVERFNHIVELAAVGILLVTILGTGVVISYTTKNLRAFAHSLRGLQPPDFKAQIEFTPHSAEESLLLQSYKDMSAVIRDSLERQRMFIANASHELKSPIAAAYMALDVGLSKKRSAEDYELTCQEVFEEVKVLKRLSSLLLDLSLLDSGENSAVLIGQCDLSALVVQMAQRWRPLFEAHRLSCRVVLPSSGLAMVKGSQEQWEIVLNNFIDNSVKYNRPQGEIKLDMSRTNQCEVILDIIDTGIGMKEEELVRLGEVFFRADPSRARQDSFGLGFAHAKRIVGGLSGTISVESRFNVGTTITIRAKRANS